MLKTTTKHFDSVKRLDSYFRLRRQLNSNLFKHLLPNPSHYYLVVFTMLEVGMVKKQDLNDLLETHVQRLTVEMTPKMRTTRATTTRISPFEMLHFLVFRHQGFTCCNVVAEKIIVK
jgi:hypothetical protein